MSQAVPAEYLDRSRGQPQASKTAGRADEGRVLLQLRRVGSSFCGENWTGALSHCHSSASGACMLSCMSMAAPGRTAAPRPGRSQDRYQEQNRRWPIAPLADRPCTSTADGDGCGFPMYGESIRIDVPSSITINWPLSGLTYNIAYIPCIPYTPLPPSPRLPVGFGGPPATLPTV